MKPFDIYVDDESNNAYYMVSILSSGINAAFDHFINHSKIVDKSNSDLQYFGCPTYKESNFPLPKHSTLKITILDVEKNISRKFTIETLDEKFEL